MIKKISQLNPLGLALSNSVDNIHEELIPKEQEKIVFGVSYKINEDDESPTYSYYGSYQCTLSDIVDYIGLNKIKAAADPITSDHFVLSNNVSIGQSGVRLYDGIDYCYPDNEHWLSVYSKANFENETFFHSETTFHGPTRFAKLINGVAYRAQWGDLGEYYRTDAFYEPGTILQFGGSVEMTIATNSANGIVSTKPGIVLNASEADDQNDANYYTIIAVCGRTPVKVRGAVKKFDKISLSEVPGIGEANLDSKTIAIALEDNDDVNVKLVMCSTKLTLD